MKYSVIAAFLFFAQSAFCLDGWWTIDLNVYSMMDITGYNNNICIQAPDGSSHQVGTGGNAAPSVNQIVITPPPGKEHDWLSMILTAISTGKNIKIYGSYSGTQITSISTNNHLSLVPAGQ
jgi:hypothetical protein